MQLLDYRNEIIYFFLGLWHRIAEDMGTRWITGTNSYLSSLINYSGDISFSALNLILSGRAASYLHNGTHFQEDKDKIVINIFNF